MHQPRHLAHPQCLTDASKPLATKIDVVILGSYAKACAAEARVVGLIAVSEPFTLVRDAGDRIAGARDGVPFVVVGGARLFTPRAGEMVAAVGVEDGGKGALACLAAHRAYYSACLACSHTNLAVRAHLVDVSLYETILLLVILC
jgi:hypothetical protein